MICKIGFTNWNAKIVFLRVSMVVTYYIKLFRAGAGRHNGILMSLLLLVAETNREKIKTKSLLILITNSKCFLFKRNYKYPLKFHLIS